MSEIRAFPATAARSCLLLPGFLTACALSTGDLGADALAPVFIGQNIEAELTHLPGEPLELELPATRCPVPLQSIVTGTTPDWTTVLGEVMCQVAGRAPACLEVAWNARGFLLRQPIQTRCKAVAGDSANASFELRNRSAVALTVHGPGGERAYLVERGYGLAD